MSEPVDIDTGSWKFYAGAGAAVVSSIVLAANGEWWSASVGVVLAGYLALHPYVRRQWYRTGYLDGHARGMITGAAMRDEQEDIGD